MCSWILETEAFDCVTKAKTWQHSGQSSVSRVVSSVVHASIQKFDFSLDGKSNFDWLGSAVDFLIQSNSSLPFLRLMRPWVAYSVNFVITVGDVSGANVGKESVAVYVMEAWGYHQVAGSGTIGRYIKSYGRFWYSWLSFQQVIPLYWLHLFLIA